MALLGACHPGPVVAVTTVATAYAAVLGRSTGGVASVAAAVLAGQLTIGWQNDFIDAQRDRAAQRRDKPIATGAISLDLVRNAAIAAGVATVPLSFLSGWEAALVHLVAVAAGLSYNLGVRATAFSPLPYLVAFALLPVFVALGLPGAPLGPWWAPVAAALLGVGAHFVNVLPDKSQDLAAGLRPLPHRLGHRSVVSVAAGCVAASSVVLAVGPAGASDWPVAFVALPLVGLVDERLARRFGFALVLVIATCDVIVLLVLGKK